MCNFIQIKSVCNRVCRGETHNTLIQLIRYTFVGGLAFLIDYSLLYILTEYYCWHYLLSAAAAFSIGLTINYILSIFWIFTEHKLHSKMKEFFVYAVIGIIGLGLNEIFMWCFTEIFLLHYMLSKLISTVFVYAWNFFSRKYILFHTKKVA